jgi:glycosyltransferase involved in cell wall biosynthesis
MVARAEGVVVLGERWRDFVVQELGLSSSQVVHILPNGVPDPGRLPKPLKGPAECHFLFLGDVCENKGISDLLVAFAHPMLRRADCRLTIAGKGETRSYRNLAHRLGIADRVRFVGWVPEPVTRELLGASDVLVLPSRFEGLPMAVIEAMAYELAVIATPVGAVPDAISDGESGLLIPVGDVRQLANALIRLVEDVELRERLQKAARCRFLARFEITEIAARLDTIYLDTMYAGYARHGSAPTVGNDRQGSLGNASAPTEVSRSDRC